MKKLLILAAVILGIISCNKTETEPFATVTSKANSLLISEGSLKSFDINDFKHVYCPYDVPVVFINQETGEVYKTIADCNEDFFNEGATPLQIPFGTYLISVNCEEAFPENQLSTSWFQWTIADTIIPIYQPEQSIEFRLDNTCGLIVFDTYQKSKVGIDLEHELTVSGINTNYPAVEWTQYHDTLTISYVKSGLYEFNYRNTYGYSEVNNVMIDDYTYKYVIFPDSVTRSTGAVPIDIEDFEGETINF